MHWMQKRYLIMCLLLLAVIVLIPLHISAQEPDASYQVSECLVNVPQDLDVECGMLTVPEDHDKPDGKTIELPVIIIHSDKPNTTPLLFTEGGPGHTSLNSVWFMRDIGMWQDRDVIILEQRGNVHANPSLTCDVSVWWEESPDNLECLNRLWDSGIDLTNYTMQQSVEDIEALRHALHIDEWNLFGTSYSTRLFMLYMHTYPDDVRSVILDSVSPPDVTRYNHDPEHSQRALDVFFRNCREDAGCSQAYPNLEIRFYDLVERLNTEPVTFTLLHDLSGYALAEPFDQAVTGHTLIDWMVVDAFYGSGYGENKTPYIPLLIDLVDKGRHEYLYPWLSNDVLSALDTGQRWAWGYYFAINCQNDFPLRDPNAAVVSGNSRLDGYIRHAREMEICEIWDLDAQPVFDGPVQSDIPTLIYAGTCDPITPPEWGKEVADNLTHAHYLEFAAEGHGVMGKSECAQDIGCDFLNNPQSLGDTSCMEDEPAPNFVVSEDVALTPGLWGSVFDIDFGTPRGSTWLEIPTIICLLLFNVTVIGEVIGVIVRRVNRRNYAQQPHRVGKGVTTGLLVAISLVGLSIPLVTSAVNRVMWSYPIMRYFGVLPGHPLVVALGILSPLFVLLHGVVIWRAISSWSKGDDGLLRKLQLSAIALFSLAMMYLVFKWDLVTILFS